MPFFLPEPAMQLLKRDLSFYPQGRQDLPRHPSMRVRGRVSQMRVAFANIVSNTPQLTRRACLTIRSTSGLGGT